MQFSLCYAYIDPTKYEENLLETQCGSKSLKSMSGISTLKLIMRFSLTPLTSFIIFFYLFIFFIFFSAETPPSLGLHAHAEEGGVSGILFAC